MGALDRWRFCPRCASPLSRAEGRAECGECGFVQYANSAPTASAFLVDDGGRVLLGPSCLRAQRGALDAPGGFLEEGESPLDGLRRELLEETSLSIEVGDFVGAFMDTYGDGPGAKAVLNLVWEACVVGGEPAPADDVSELRWFTCDALPADPELAFRWLGPSLRAWA